MNVKHILRTASAWILSASLTACPVFGAGTAEDSRTVDPGRIVQDIMDEAAKAADSIEIPDFEGTVHVAASDGMRGAVAEHYRSEDDMSWIEGADIVLRGSQNDSGGIDLQAVLCFNDTELYHLNVSYDRQQNDLYIVCPELKDEVLLFPVGDFSADAQTITGRKVTPEMIADYMSVFRELNDLISSISLEEVQSEWEKYAPVIMKYVDISTGIMTITAGSLSKEGHTTTVSVSEEAIHDMIPELLKLLSEDALLQKILESPFAGHVFRLFVRNKALKLLPDGALWNLAKQALIQAADRDYSWNREFSVTLALDRDQTPIHLSASVKQGGMNVEMFEADVIIDGGDHAFEIKIGPALGRLAGFKKMNKSVGLLAQGNLKDDILRETVSITSNGEAVPVFRIRGLDLLEFRNIWMSGIFDVMWKNSEYSCDFHTDDNGMRTMIFSVNGDEWFALTADLKKTDSAGLDELDLSEAFRVDSRKAFFKYMRDASAIRMFEKLASAGVPQEYVDMLTDGEAATESSRENTIERE